MLSVGKGASAGAVGAYFQQPDYYSKDGNEAQGVWRGSGAKALGLYGKTVDPEVFEKYLDGQFPGRPTMGKMVDGVRQRTPGWDNTASSPPGMSVAIEVYGDKDLERIHNKSVASLAKFIENHSLTVRSWDKQEEKQVARKDQKAIIASYRHRTSRNLDPATHTHLFFINAGLDKDQKWRSLDSQASFYNPKMLHGMVFRSEEAYRVKSSKREIYTYTKDSKFYYDLKNVPKEMSETFSSRSQDIKNHLGPGEHSAAAKADAALATRKGKTTADLDGLKKGWRKTVEGLGYNFEKEKQRNLPQDMEVTRRTPRAIYNHSIEHLKEGNSVFTQNDLLFSMLSRGLGDIRYPDANREIGRAIRDGRLTVREDTAHKQDRLLTTPELQNAERNLLELERSGRTSRVPVFIRAEIGAKLAHTDLNPSQAQAVQKTLLSTSSVIGIQGVAGAGKTYSSVRIVRALESKGFKAIILAPSSSVVSDLARDMTKETQTLQTFLKRPEGSSNNIILLDEASMVGTQDMAKLLRTADERGISRVILMGDKRQLASAQAGSPFALLQEAGMRTAVIDKIVRQEDSKHQEMVRHAYEGDIDKAFSILDKDIRETSYDQIDLAAVDAWVKHPKRDQVTIVASTNARIDRINAEIKTRLKASGDVQKDGITNKVYKPLNVSRADRSQIGNYIHADAVQFFKGYKPLGIRANEIYKIGGVDSTTGKVKLIGRGEKTIIFTPSKSSDKMGSFSLLKESQIEIGAGDKLMFTANAYKHKLDNKDKAVVLGVSAKTVRLSLAESGVEKTISLNDPAMRFAKHAWAGTNHATQGKSVTGVIVPSEIKGFKSEMQKTAKTAEKIAERERVLVKTRT